MFAGLTGWHLLIILAVILLVLVALPALRKKRDEAFAEESN